MFGRTLDNFCFRISPDYLSPLYVFLGCSCRCYGVIFNPCWEQNDRISYHLNMFCPVQARQKLVLHYLSYDGSK